MNVHTNANLINLKATFTRTGRGDVFVDGKAQKSGETSNDFTGTVMYIVIDEKGEKKDYYVTISRTELAYVVSLNEINLCAIKDYATGVFSECKSTVVSKKAKNIVVNKSRTYAYVSDLNNAINVCKVRIDGSLYDCQIAGEASIKNVGDITLNQSETYLYVTDAGDTIVKACNINNLDGKFLNCKTIFNDSQFYAINGITLNDNQKLAYITSGVQDQVNLCSINEYGAFSGCKNIRSTGKSNFYNKIYLDNNSIYIINNYASSSDSISKCTVKPDGTLTDLCNDTTFTYDINAMFIDGSNAYIVSNNKVSICKIDNLSSCIDSGGVFNSSYGIFLLN